MQAAASSAVIGPTVAAPLLLERLHLGAAAVGLYMALVYLGATFATQLGAFLVGRWGPIRASQWSLLCIALGLLLVASPVLPLVALGAVIVGLGYGPITPASSQMLARTTEPQHYALVFSVKQTGVPLGGVVAGLIVPPLAATTGTVGALVGLAALCGLASICAGPLARELDRGCDTSAHWPRPRQILAPMLFVARHPVLKSIALCTFVFSIVQVSLTSYMVSFLTGDLGWALSAAGATLAASQAFGVGARIVWGLVADRWFGPRQVLLGLALAMLCCGVLMPVLTSASSDALVIALLCVYGATAVGWNGVALATVARFAPTGQAATATGGTLFFTFFGVVVGPPIFGAMGSGLGALGWAFSILALPLAGSLWLLWRADFR